MDSSILATIFAGVALVVSVVGTVLAYSAGQASARSATASERSAASAVAADLRQRTPVLTVSLIQRSAAQDGQARYSLRNEGPQDLSSVVVPAPITADRIAHLVAVDATGWMDWADLGPIPMGEAREFKLYVGTPQRAESRWLAEVWVVVDCRSATDAWQLPMHLAPPFKFGARVISP